MSDDKRQGVGLGLFSRTFTRPTLASVLDAVAGRGFDLVHLNFASAGRPTLPEGLTGTYCEAVRREVEARGLRLAGVSATFNAVHPDVERRTRETALAAEVVSLAPILGAPVVSLCTGTRDADDMWRGHAANDEPAAWGDLRATLDRLLEAAVTADVELAIEPEVHNVVSSAGHARRLLDQVSDRHLRVILDAANLLSRATLPRQREVLTEAIDLLGPDIAVVHAKDVTGSGYTAAGLGLLDYDLYFALLVGSGIAAPVIIHEVAEPDVDRARWFVIEAAKRVGLTIRQ